MSNFQTCVNILPWYFNPLLKEMECHTNCLKGKEQ